MICCRRTKGSFDRSVASDAGRVAARPCVRAFLALVCFPRAVLGPVLFAAFRRLAAARLLWGATGKLAPPRLKPIDQVVASLFVREYQAV